MDLPVQVITLPLGTGTQRSHGVVAPFHAAVAACRRRRIEQQDVAWWLLRSKDTIKPTPPEIQHRYQKGCFCFLTCISFQRLPFWVSMLVWFGGVDVQAGRVWNIAIEDWEIPTTLKLYFRGGRGYPPKIQKNLLVLYSDPPPSWMY